MNKLMTVLLTAAALTLSACGSAPAGKSSTSSIGSGSTSFTNKASAAVVIFDGTSNTDLANALGTSGDNSGNVKRVVLSIPLTGLSGKTLTAATLNLTYDSSSANPVSSLGQYRAYKIPQTGSPGTASWSASETLLGSLFSTNPGAISSGTAVTLDVKTALQAAINAGDSYLTLKLRFDTDSAGGTNQITLFMNYSSVPLSAYVPNITGTY